MYLLSINNPCFENYLGQMYLVEPEIKDTTDNIIYTSYLGFTIVDQEGWGNS